MHIEIDDKGYTRVTDGAPDAHVCLQSDSQLFFRFYFKKVLSNSSAEDGSHSQQ
jgi:hypothetical protein